MAQCPYAITPVGSLSSIGRRARPTDLALMIFCRGPSGPGLVGAFALCRIMQRKGWLWLFCASQRYWRLRRRAAAFAAVSRVAAPCVPGGRTFSDIMPAPPREAKPGGQQTARRLGKYRCPDKFSLDQSQNIFLPCASTPEADPVFPWPIDPPTPPPRPSARALVCELYVSGRTGSDALAVQAHWPG